MRKNQHPVQFLLLYPQRHYFHQLFARNLQLFLFSSILPHLFPLPSPFPSLSPNSPHIHPLLALIPDLPLMIISSDLCLLSEWNGIKIKSSYAY